MLTFVLGLLIGFIACFLLLIKPAVAEAPTTKNEDYIIEDIKIKDNAIINDPSRIQIVKPKQNQIEVGISRIKQPPNRQHYSGKTHSKEEVQDLIIKYSEQYGISPSLPLRIAQCESGFNPLSKNKSSSASGVFQYLSSTWKATDQGKAGLSVFDAEANVKAAISYIASRGHAKPWNSSKSCWNK